jgi:N-methylhydantoinase B
MVDPVLFQIVRNRFTTAAEEIGVAITRNAYSTLIKEQNDASAGIFTAGGELVAQASMALIHIASLRSCLAELLRDFPLEEIADGDIYIANDPYRGGIHANDINLFRPVFFDGALRYWATTLVHVADLGGIAPGGLPAKASELWHEGLVIPPVRLYARGEESAAVFKLIAANSRTPVKVLGDLRALVAGANVGADRILALLEKYGPALVEETVRELLDYAERRTRQAFAALPDGEYRGEYLIDDDGNELDRRYRVSVTVTIRGDELEVDLTGTDPQARGPINASRSQTTSAIIYTTRCLVDPEVPMNEGGFRPVRIHLPEGTLVNPRLPAPCNARIITVMAVIEAMLRALAPVAPPRRGAIAPSSVLQVLTLSGNDAGRYWIHNEYELGGTGARSIKDGVDSSGSHIISAGMGGLPVEASELEYPVRYESYRLWTDSGGAGKHRGGLGVRKDIRILQDGHLNVRADRIKYPPPGALGGQAGKGGGYVLNEGSAQERRLPTKDTGIPIRAGDRLTVFTSGGGGFGLPSERPPELVQADVRSGRVSLESARRDYGVHLDEETLAIDWEQTREARGSRLGVGS